MGECIKDIPYRSLTLPSDYADPSAIRCDMAELKAWTCPHCVDEAKVLATGGLDGITPLWYVASNNSHIVVSLAGTNTRRLDSINTNLQFLSLYPLPEHFPDTWQDGVRLHAGYYNAFMLIEPAISAAIASEIDKTATKEIVVTGHSLGGAIGSILATYLMLKYPKRVTGRFFAPPRQGNGAWADYVDRIGNGRIQHMNNYNDIVPHLPPRVLDYRHYGHEIYITSWGGEQYIGCEGQENRKCTGQFMRAEELIGSLVPHLDAIVHSGPYAGVMMGCVGDFKKVGDAGEEKVTKQSTTKKPQPAVSEAKKAEQQVKAAASAKPLEKQKAADKPKVEDKHKAVMQQQAAVKLKMEEKQKAEADKKEEQEAANDEKAEARQDAEEKNDEGKKSQDKNDEPEGEE